jgi:hypothetical protein
MIFHGTKLPDDVSIALDKGELVIFVGAGVSKPPPSNLPLFDGLVVEIGKQFGISLSIKDARGREDRILGEWHDAKHDVHKAAVKVLNNVQSRPTQLHSEILRVFKESNRVRIVTTNMDRNLSEAAHQIFPGDKIDEYYAPALPLGDAFEGLVYLHGSISEKPNKLVLTKEDFGKAYISIGWASKFLLSLFSKYTVLFVGYSHSDVLVGYLAQGLKHAGVMPRWSLISSDASEEDRKNWQHLGIQTEEYLVDNDHPENPHNSLTEFFKEWTAFVNESILDRANRLKLTIRSKFPEDNATVERIDYYMKDPRLAQEVCESIEDEDWITWMDQRGYFTPFFNDGKQIEDCNKKLEPNENVIAYWLCSFVRKAYPETLLALLEKNNQAFNINFAKILAHELWTKRDKFDDPRFNTWVSLLISNGPNIISPEIWAYILKECKLPENTGVALKILEFLTTPELHLRKPFSILPLKETDTVKKVDYEIEWPPESDYWLKETWEKIFRPAIPELGDELMALAVKQLSSAHLLLKGVSKANEYYDSLSGSRSSIAPHVQNRDTIHICLFVLIDAAREILEYWLNNDPYKGEYYIHVWDKSNVPLLKRLAIHGVGLDVSMSADDRIKWLLDRDLIYAWGMKKEVFDVLKVSYRFTSREIRQSLISRIKEGIRNEKLEDRIIAYEKFNILTWLRKSVESCDLLRTALEEISHNYPDFAEHDHPEFDTWIGGVEFVDPREGVDFAKILAEEPSNYVDSILSASETSIFRDRWQHLTNLKELFEKDRIWTEQFIRNLVSRRIWDRDIWRAVFFALTEIIKSQEDWNWILGLIETLPENREIYATASELISSGFWRRESDVNDDIIERGYAIISKAWALCKDDDSEFDDSSGDLLTSAINHEGGWIGEFWIHYTSHLKQKAKDSWQGIPNKLKEQIIQTVQGKGKTATYSRIAITRWTPYLLAWDELFAKTHLLPLFDWNIDQSIAEQTWPVYIGYRRLTYVPMEALLIPHYKQLVDQLNSNRRLKENLSKSNLLHNLGFKLAGLVMRVIPNPLQSGFIREVIPKLSEDMLGSLAHGMGNFLKEMKPEEQKGKWDLWIKEYLDNRLNGIPSEFVLEETRYIAAWCLYLGDLFPESVKLLEKMHLKKVFAYNHTKEILHSPLLDKYPEEACKFCVIVMRAEDFPSLHSHLLELLTKFELLISDSEWLVRFKEELYKRGWSPEENQK